MTEDRETPDEDAEGDGAARARDADEDEPTPADRSGGDAGPTSSGEPETDVGAGAHVDEVEARGGPGGDPEDDSRATGEGRGAGAEAGAAASGEEGDRPEPGEPSDGGVDDGREPGQGTGPGGRGERGGGGPGDGDEERGRDERSVDEGAGDEADPRERTVDAAAAGRGVAAEIEAARPGEADDGGASGAGGDGPGTGAAGGAPGATGEEAPGVPPGADESRDDVPEDVRSYDRFQKVDRASYDRVNEFLRDRTYITAREWAIARLCADFRTATGVEMTKIGENLPHLVPFMTDTYSPQAVNQARSAFEEKVRMSGATFLYGAMSGFFTADELDDIMYEVTEVAKFLLEVEGVELAVDEELDSEDRISAVMREVRRASAELRHDGVECPECGHRLHQSGAEADVE